MENLSILNNLFLVLFALGISLCAGNLGFIILSALNKTGIEHDEDYRTFLPFYSLGTGFAVISMGMYALSVFGAINKYSIWGILTLQVALLFMNNKLHRFFSCPHKRFLTPAVCLFMIFFISGLIISSTPTLETDSATTYLNAAKLFLQYNRIIDVGNIVGNMAKNVFMLIVYGLGLNSALLSQVLLFIISFSGILHCFLLISRRVNPTFASLVMVVFVSMHHQADVVVGTAKVDGIVFTYSVLALSSILHLFENGGLSRKAYVCMNGIFVGYLMGLSYLYPPAFALYLLFLMAYIHKAGLNFRSNFIILVSWLICVTLTSLPTYLYNVADFANPMYPYYGNIFGRGLGGDIGGRSFVFSYINEVKNNFSAHNIVTFLLLPLILFINPSQLQSGREYLFAGMWVLASIAMLIAGMAILFGREKLNEGYFKFRDSRIFIIVFAGYAYFYAFWAKSQFVLRYFAIGFPFLLLLTAFLLRLVYDYFNLKKSSKFGFVFLLCFSGIALLSFEPLISRTKTACASIFNRKSVDSIVSERFSYALRTGRMSNFGKAIIVLKEKLKEGDKVLSFLTGNYYFGDDAVVFSGNGALTLPSHFGVPKPLYEFSDYEEFEKALRENGFTYIVINPDFLYLSKDEERIVLSYMKNRRADLMVDDIFIYRLSERP